MNNQIFQGNGVTYSIGSDKYPYTILSYENNVLKLQKDSIQNGNIVVNPNGIIESFKMYSNKWFRVEINPNTGRYNKKGRAILIFGSKNSFIDPSF